VKDGATKTKEQLKKELVEAHRLIAELEKQATKRAEEPLGERQAWLDSIFRAAPIGIGVVANRMLLEVNDCICEMTGYAPEELTGKSARILYPTQKDFDFVGIEKYLQIQYRGIGSVETRWRRKDGTIIDIFLSSAAIIEDDLSAGVTFTALDITGRKKAEEELKIHRDHLEELVKEHTAKLIGANERMKKEIEERKQVEDALRMSEEKYELHFSRSNDVMFSYDNQFRFLSISPNVERILGYKPKEMIGKTFLDLNILHPEDVGRAAKNSMDVMSGRMIRSSIYQFITKNGARIFGEVSGIPLKRKGSVVSVISVARDITKHIEMEKSLRESAEKYRLHFSLSNDVMFSYDNQFKVLSVSPNVERLLGYKPEELVGRNFQDLNVLHPDYMDEAVDNALHVLSGETIYSSIYEFITKDGTRKFGEVQGVPLIREGQVVGVISVARDITERIEKEMLLQESKETALALLNASTDFMALIDITGTIIFMNKAASENLGRSVKGLLGTCLFDHLPKDVAKRRKIHSEKVISSGKPIRFEDENRGRLIQNNLYPVCNARGKVTRIAIYARDITERKQAFFKGNV
jgi:two-component system cell cycle sensor histidine kinase/response regulator CckA